MDAPGIDCASLWSISSPDVAGLAGVVGVHLAGSRMGNAIGRLVGHALLPVFFFPLHDQYLELTADGAVFARMPFSFTDGYRVIGFQDKGYPDQGLSDQYAYNEVKTSPRL